jgi:hypothetical protein
MEQVRSKAFKFKRNFGYAERQERSLFRQEAKALKADADVLEFYIINDILNTSDVSCSHLGRVIASRCFAAGVTNQFLLMKLLRRWNLHAGYPSFVLNGLYWPVIISNCRQRSSRLKPRVKG